MILSSHIQKGSRSSESNFRFLERSFNLLEKNIVFMHFAHVGKR